MKRIIQFILVCQVVFYGYVFGMNVITEQKTRIINISGTAQIRLENRNEWNPVSMETKLQMGCDLKTLDNSKLKLSIEPTISVNLEKNSLLRINKILKNESVKALRMTLFIQNGVVRFDMPSYLGYKLLLTIKTPSATIYTRNAAMKILVLDNVTTLELENGTAKIRHNDNELKTLLYSGSKAVVHPYMTNVNVSKLSKQPVESTSVIKSSSVTKKKDEKISVAILNINSKMISNEDLEPVSDYVAQEIEKQSNTEVYFLDDVRSMLRAEGAKNILKCSTDSCISKIGSYLGVDMVVIGKLGQVGKKYIFNLKMIDVLRDKTKKRVNTVIENDLGYIFTEVPKMISTLIDDEIVTKRVRKNSVNTPKSSSVTFTQKKSKGMEYIFKGSFKMGSEMNTGEMDEWPTHKVTLDDFYIDKYEVTKEAFEMVMGYNPSGVKGCATCPVDNVTWFEAEEYCRKVNKRLPTEAEWEYSCRSGTSTIFHYGNTLSSDKSNFNGSKPYGGAPQGIVRNKALPVGNFEPNKWKLYDMHGNVSEWCSDWYSENYYGNSESKNPGGPEKGKFKVVRGGSWRDNANTLRTTNRTSYNPSIRLKSIGFRCAKDTD